MLRIMAYQSCESFYNSWGAQEGISVFIRARQIKSSPIIDIRIITLRNGSFSWDRLLSKPN